MDEQQLAEQIAGCQAGRPEAFSRLLAEFGPRLYRYFYRACGSEADAEDMVQELFVRLLEKIGSYEHQGKFEHWLFRVAANLSRDRLRHKARTGPILSLQHVTHDELELGDTLAADGPEPDGRMQQAQQMDALQKALSQLPPPDREIILMRHYGGMSFKELAEHFNLPLGTALAKVHRGLKKLQKLMNDYEN